jgi:hypothetical protein
LNPARILRCRVLLIPILGLVGCYYSEAKQTCEVDITINQNTCTVTVKPPCTTDSSDHTVPLVSPGDTVFWNPSGYTVSFKPLLGIFHHTPVGVLTLPSGSPAAKAVTRDGWCSTVHLCSYNYSLTAGTQLCADPGVHVVPPSTNIWFYAGLVALLGFGTYAVLRIRLRN